MPGFVAPQLARLTEVPPSGANWVHEVKFDGYRTQMRVEDGKVRLLTRKGLDWTARFPEIAEDGRALPDCLIDGEICALDKEGISDFGGLQLALSDKNTGALVFFLFDCLFAAGHDLRSQALRTRKEMLEEILGHSKSRRLRYVKHFPQDGPAMLKAACQADMEGIVSKKLTAPYVSGRMESWTKAKCRGGQEVVIGAWRGSADKMRSLLVGTFQDGKFTYMGRVGTGYSAGVAGDLLRKLKPLRRATSPFAVAPPRVPDVNWVEPKLVAEIEFENVTSDGIFRQAAFKGLRADKPAESVVREVPAKTPPPTEKSAMATKKAAKSDDIVLGVTISNPGKALWSKSKLGPAVTKLDLARYMAAAAEKMLPHVTERPLSIVRTPDGIGGETFYQRHSLKGTQAKMLAIKVSGEKEPYLGLDSAQALVALAQQGVTEIHPWGSKPGEPDVPERIILDLDPAPDVPFDAVIAGALELKKRLEALGFTPFVKTTGGKGLHVVIAIKGADWAEAKAFAKAVAVHLEEDMPERYTTNMAKKARTGKIFVDYLRNDRTSTGVAPWSPRAREGATIAVPVAWAHVKKGLDPLKWTIHTADAVLRKADPWAGLAKSAKALGPALKKLGV
jgi:bifunctional non-homologous end joining protein LigD